MQHNPGGSPTMKLPHLTVRSLLVLLVSFATLCPSLVSQENIPAEKLEFFENKVRQLLVGKCY